MPDVTGRGPSQSDSGPTANGGWRGVPGAGTDRPRRAAQANPPAGVAAGQRRDPPTARAPAPPDPRRQPSSPVQLRSLPVVEAPRGRGLLDRLRRPTRPAPTAAREPLTKRDQSGPRAGNRTGLSSRAQVLDDTPDLPANDVEVARVLCLGFARPSRLGTGGPVGRPISAALDATQSDAIRVQVEAGSDLAPAAWTTRPDLGTHVAYRRRVVHGRWSQALSDGRQPDEVETVGAGPFVALVGDDFRDLAERWPLLQEAGLS
jgi:hypothetical protein